MEQREPKQNIYAAHRQWAKRPPDECFQTLEDLHNFCSGYRERSYTASFPVSVLGATSTGDDDIKLVPRVTDAYGEKWADTSMIPRSGPVIHQLLIQAVLLVH